MKKEPYNIKETVGYHVASTHFHMKKRLSDSFKVAGFKVSPDQWSILAYLYMREPKSQKSIAKYLEKDNASITRILDLLQKKGLLKREVSSQDRRVFLICLTTQGEKLASDLIDHVSSLGKYSPLTKDEKQTLKDLLSKLR